MIKKIIIGVLLVICLPTLSVEATDSKPVKKTSIDVPEELDRNYDELLSSWAKKGRVIQCDYQGESAILFDDATYIKRLYALPTKMELAYNDIVKGFIEMYAGRRRGQVSYMLGQGAYYFPMFEEALDKEGLPLELKYLPVIESALNPIARSRVGATGLWQFMPATGKLYKLEINSLVDERRDSYKSTQAAVQYLKDMYNIYGDWNLVIAAYNCGPGNVNKAIRRSGGKKDYWEIYPYLPRETRGYVPAFIAATYIMNYHEEHKICPATTDLPVLVDTLGINKLVHFEQIAGVLKLDVDEIRRLNPQYKEDVIPGEYKEYALKLPLTDLTSFIKQEDTIYAHRRDELLTHKQVRNVASQGNSSSGGGYATHKVKKGETLGAIAMRYGTSVSQIKKWNNMRSDRLSIGQSLQVSNYIAPKKTEPTQASQQVAREETKSVVAKDGVLKEVVKTTKTVTANYQVKRGDTWSGISKKTGSSVADIKKWNGIKDNSLIAGRNLKIQKVEVLEELKTIPKPGTEHLKVDLSEMRTTMGEYVEAINPLEVSENIGFGDDQTPLEDSSVPEGNVETIYHKVLYGESLSQIAAKYGVSVEDIISWNNISKESENKVDSLLIILPEESEEKKENDNIMDNAGRAA